MAAINTRNVHRSNLLLKHAYGTDFVYDEMLVTGPGERAKPSPTRWRATSRSAPTKAPARRRPLA